MVLVKMLWLLSYEKVKKLMDIRKKIIARGDAESVVSKIFKKTNTGDKVHKLIDKYDPEFRKKLKDAAKTTASTKDSSAAFALTSPKVSTKNLNTVNSTKTAKLEVENTELNNSAIKDSLEKEIQDAITKNQLDKIFAKIENTKTTKETTQKTTKTTRLRLRKLVKVRTKELNAAEQNKLSKLKEAEQNKLKKRISRLKLQGNDSMPPNSNIKSIMTSSSFNDSLQEIL